jgi:hypothetical protein
MKYLLIYTFISTLFFIKQDQSLVGKYEMQYENEYSSHNGSIEFKEGVYERKLLNGQKIKGSITFENRDIVLKDSNTGLEMRFFKIHRNRDTIYFKTNKIDERAVPKNDITIYSGKLIKLKQ